jgi:hypothetical protein
MKNMNKVAVFFAASLASLATSSALAADWDVKQSANLTSAAPALNQGNSANVTSGNQALNAVVLKAGNKLVSGSQTVTVTATGGSQLTQGTKVTTSNQALNLISVDGADIGDTSEVEQTVNLSGGGLTLLTQSTVTAGANNVQSLNFSNTANSGAILQLKQVYIDGDSLSLVQDAAATAGNSQGVNYAKSAGTIGVTANGLTQSVVVGKNVTFSQGAGSVGGSNVQAGNRMISTGAILKSTQAFSVTANDLTFTQATATGTSNRQAANMIGVTGANAIGADTKQTLTVSAGKMTLNQTAADTGNYQAGNLAVSAGTVAGLIQEVKADTATVVEFNQTATGAENIQAGNMVVSTGVISGISQNFEGSKTITNFVQDTSANKLIQAGNLIDLGVTGTITQAATTVAQTFSVSGGNVDLVQKNNTTNQLQSFNAIVYASTNAAAGTSVGSQVLTITGGATFDMTQDAVTTSGQYGNFVGVKY